MMAAMVFTGPQSGLAAISLIVIPVKYFDTLPTVPIAIRAFVDVFLGIRKRPSSVIDAPMLCR